MLAIPRHSVPANRERPTALIDDFRIDCWSAARLPELSRHSIRTPLLAVRSAAELLASGHCGPLSEPARGLIREISQAGAALDRLSEMLFRLVELSSMPPAPALPMAISPVLAGLGLGQARDDRLAFSAAPEFIEELSEHLRQSGLCSVIGVGQGQIVVDFGADEVVLQISMKPVPDDDRALVATLATRLAEIGHGRVVSSGVDRLDLAWRLVE